MGKTWPNKPESVQDTPGIAPSTKLFGDTRQLTLSVNHQLIGQDCFNLYCDAALPRDVIHILCSHWESCLNCVKRLRRRGPLVEVNYKVNDIWVREVEPFFVKTAKHLTVRVIWPRARRL